MRGAGYFVFALAIALALFARMFYPRIDINKERERVTSKVCSQPSLAESRRALDDLHFDEVFELPEEKKITAWKRYAARWSMRAVVFVRIDASVSPTTCKVEGFHVGR